MFRTINHVWMIFHILLSCFLETVSYSEGRDAMILWELMKGTFIIGAIWSYLKELKKTCMVTPDNSWVKILHFHVFWLFNWGAPWLCYRKYISHAHIPLWKAHPQVYRPLSFATVRESSFFVTRRWLVIPTILVNLLFYIYHFFCYLQRLVQCM